MVAAEIVVGTCHPFATGLVSIRGADHGRAGVSERRPTAIVMLRDTTIGMNRLGLSGENPLMIVGGCRWDNPFTIALRKARGRLPCRSYRMKLLVQSIRRSFAYRSDCHVQKYDWRYSKGERER